MSNNKYEKAKVYKIWSTQGDKIYVGSTCKEYLSQRMVSHRGDYNKWKKGTYGHITSFDLFEEYGVKNCFIELLEGKCCNSKDELRQLEGKYIRELDCINKCIAGQTRNEYNKRYTEDNKDKITEYKKNYYIDNKERLSEKMKQNYTDNKEKISLYHKHYRKENIEKITEHRKQKYNCECGGKYTHVHKTRHLSSIKHCQFIESQLTKPEDDVV